MDTTQALGISSVERTKLFIWDGNTFESIWPEVELILLKDERHWSRYFTLESFRDLVRDPNVYAWTFHDDGGCVAVLFTQFEVWPIKTVCRFLWASALPGHGLRVLRDHLEFVELWAKRSGAAETEMIGRPGWLRIMPEDYSARYVVLTKDLSDVKEH